MAVSEQRGPAVLVVSSLVFGAMAFVAKLATARLPGAQVALVRFLVGTAAVAVAGFGFGVRMRPHNLRGLALRGLFGGIAVLGYFVSISHLAVGMATLLNYTFPIFSTLFAAVFLGEALRRSSLVALVLTFAGVVMTVRGNGGPLHFGFGPWELLALGSSVLSGAAVTTIRAVRRTDGAWEIFGAFCVVGAIAVAPIAIGQWVPPTLREWLLLLAMGLLAVIAQLLMTWALGYVPMAVSGVISLLVPVTALLLGIALLDEPARPFALAGSALTLGGVVWCAWPQPAKSSVS
jgi:drug/metabolite transporter (DMT)-like permease